MSFDIDAESLQVFTEECTDLIDNAEDVLLKLETSPDDNELINELFRLFHTIKGSSGLFGFDDIVSFTHVAESVLGRVREGEMALDEDVLGLMLVSRDHLSVLVGHVIETGAAVMTESILSESNNIIKKLNVYLTGKAAEEIVVETDECSGAPPSGESACLIESKRWHISLRFKEDALRHGMDPLSFIRYLEKLGQIVSAVTHVDTIPAFDSIDPESCYLGFDISLDAKTTTDEIKEVFEFVEDDCDVHIVQPNAEISRYLELIEALPEEPGKVGEVLVRCGALTATELNEALEMQRTGIQTTRETEVEVASTEAVSQAVVAPSSTGDAAEGSGGAQDKQESVVQKSVRVSSDKLEALVDLVGELVIAGANTSLVATVSENVQIIEAMEGMSRLVEEIRDTTLGLRMVQIGDTFNRYRRVVREASKDLGKDIDLRISGGESELDKTVVEKIGDPLMHLIRNAVDHGIESAEAREAAGKPVKGVINLNAFHDSGSIVIEITDDGGGLPKDKILAKALEKDLVPPSVALTDNDVYRLIFEPGFSTAEKVTNLSGRGVGMDVVRRNIEMLRGSVDVSSTPGEGSTFQIRLPLTLAIIDGFQVRVGSSHYIIPLDMVVECVELSKEEKSSMADSNYVNLRGEVLPYVRVGEWLNVPGERSHRENIVVVKYAGQTAGLVVDDLLGEYQTVLKPLGPVFENLKGISGATILGSGEVAMILDVGEFIKMVSKSSRGVQRVLSGGEPSVPSAVH